MKEALHKMIGFVSFWVIVGVITVALVSCTTPPSRVEMDYGTSARLAVVNQTLNPEAGKNLEPVTGLDGKTAEGIMKKYREGFEKEAPAPTYSFTIGDIGK